MASSEKTQMVTTSMGPRAAKPFGHPRQSFDKLYKTAPLAIADAQTSGPIPTDTTTRHGDSSRNTEGTQLWELGTFWHKPDANWHHGASLIGPSENQRNADREANEVSTTKEWEHATRILKDYDPTPVPLVMTTLDKGAPPTSTEATLGWQGGTDAELQWVVPRPSRRRPVVLA